MKEVENQIIEQSDKAYSTIRERIIVAQNSVYTAVNTAMVQAYWEIGEQIALACGQNDRAEYGKQLLKSISERLTKEFGNGYSVQSLRNMRQFYITFPIRSALRSELSWTHYRMLMRVENEQARNYYADECAKSHWSSRQLERQISTFFYQRMLASSQENRAEVASEIEKLEPKPEYQKIIRDPYVLEFLDLTANPKFYEKDLESALIENIQKFLLELGRGFCFEARQKRIVMDGENFFIDLVFYNYILKCFVLVDLKLGKLTHQDIGQMQMYTNYYTMEMMNPGDNLPIGIILCADKNESLVKYTMANSLSQQVFTSRYMVYMPTEEELRKELNLGKYQKLDSQ